MCSWRSRWMGSKSLPPSWRAGCKPALRSHLLLGVQVVVIIPIGNLTSCRQPYLLMATNIFQGLYKVFMAIGNADDKWMEGDRHHPAVHLPFLVEDVKLILDGLQEVCPTVPLAHEKGNIV